MPTYEYACDACGHKFEEFQSITSKPVKKCPVCKKNKVKRLISAGAGLVFGPLRARPQQLAPMRNTTAAIDRALEKVHAS